MGGFVQGMGKGELEGRDVERGIHYGGKGSREEVLGGFGWDGIG